jgi:hypothetical protein
MRTSAGDLDADDVRHRISTMSSGRTRWTSRTRRAQSMVIIDLKEEG